MFSLRDKIDILLQTVITSDSSGEDFETLVKSMIKLHDSISNMDEETKNVMNQNEAEKNLVVIQKSESCLYETVV